MLRFLAKHCNLENAEAVKTKSLCAQTPYYRKTNSDGVVEKGPP